MMVCRQAILPLVAFYGVVDAFIQSRNRCSVGQNRPLLFAETTNSDGVEVSEPAPSGGFDTDTALFCAGLAFDAYVEPPADSSRWERGVSNAELMFNTASSFRW